MANIPTERNEWSRWSSDSITITLPRSDWLTITSVMEIVGEATCDKADNETDPIVSCAIGSEGERYLLLGGLIYNIATDRLNS